MMGDMADYYNELGENQGWFAGRSKYSPVGKTKINRDVVCKKCGNGRLTWADTEIGWRLFDQNAVEHQCNAVTESDFEVLDGN